MRAFIGVDFDVKTKDYIYGVQQKMKGYAEKGRWKNTDNFHLTLKFLDDISSKQQELIDIAVKEICAARKSFELYISDAGIFKSRDSVRVLWLGLSGDILRLSELYGLINKSLMPIGFDIDKRAFNPHITMGQDIIFKTSFEEMKNKTGKVIYGPVGVNSLYLFKSEQIGNRRVYSKVAEYPLIG